MRGEPVIKTIELLRDQLSGGSGVLDSSLGSCALVAPSPGVKGKGYGAAIDTADVVIHMSIC